MSRWIRFSALLARSASPRIEDSNGLHLDGTYCAESPLSRL
ncbi:hypothetical protein TC41_3121 [Alicyclobacillus acidocaldarius subsp. acidocaldarius Tc-4-1]|uniref:Uncharacterized protein n=1 Tax=Alicyclobacillus acidocaldarius (strain Tc-4-1) TaxID=1048834 RepID=F8ID00_ALIAT|nr:hypothetical protein TC41_3121 [Alicyclobacillus acidocaldarius subsp. acidocaldarius Tc-4-1]